MLRAAAAAATAVVFAAAADDKGYPASYWEVEEMKMKASAHARQLWVRFPGRDEVASRKGLRR
jgi:hypothetical protein